jgi:hypothetical protein
MDGLSVAYILRDGLALSSGLLVLIAGALYFNPRIMLRSYPQAVQAQLPPLTASEKRQQMILALLVWGFALLWLLFSNIQLAARSDQVTVVTYFLHTYLVFAVFNLVDLLVIDYLLLLVIRPAFLFIPGTAALSQAHGFGFHFKGFLKGLAFGSVLGAVVTLLAALIL